jgi:hypothetical protein
MTPPKKRVARLSVIASQRWEDSTSSLPIAEPANEADALSDNDDELYLIVSDDEFSDHEVDKAVTIALKWKEGANQNVLQFIRKAVERHCGDKRKLRLK